jgi:hypothetical protein
MAGRPRRRLRRALLNPEETKAKRILRLKHKGIESHPEFFPLKVKGELPVGCSVEVYGVEPHPLGWELLGSVRFVNGDAPPVKWSKNIRIGIFISAYWSEKGPSFGQIKILEYSQRERDDIELHSLLDKIVRAWFGVYGPDILSRLPERR